MKIVFVTREDPIFIPLYLEPSLKNNLDNKFYIVIMEGVPPNSRDYRYLLKLLKLYGPKDFIIKVLQLVLYKMAMFLPASLTKRYYSVIKMARDYNAILHYTSDVNGKKFLNWLKKIKPDIVMSVTCPQIFKNELLSLPNKGCLNIHTSLLPKNKGWEPVFWAMYKGEKHTGVTVHWMVERFDSGPILVQKRIKIKGGESWFELNKVLAKLGGEAIKETLEGIKSGVIKECINDSKKETINHFPSVEEVRNFKKKGLIVVKFSEIFPS